MQDEVFADVRPSWIILREYAHPIVHKSSASERNDFTETLYWHAGLKTDAKTGTASVNFHLSDSITTFKVQADAFDKRGALGSSDSDIVSVKPFYVEARWPLSLTQGDEVLLPVTVHNKTSKTISDVELFLSSSSGNLTAKTSLSLSEHSRQTTYLSFTAHELGDIHFSLQAKGGENTDRILHKLNVEARGFPIQFQSGGELSEGKPGQLQVTLPPSIQDGSLKTIAKVYPTPLANLEEALQSLLVQPHGCFEQTSSTNYPLVMAQQYFLTHHGVNPEKISKAQELLKKGYDRLLGFECKEGGFEWFGKGDGHEDLTAYGLMQFHDMKSFMDVDSDMLSRTMNWLLNRRDGQGGFEKPKKARLLWRRQWTTS